MMFDKSVSQPVTKYKVISRPVRHEVCNPVRQPDPIPPQMVFLVARTVVRCESCSDSVAWSRRFKMNRAVVHGILRLLPIVLIVSLARAEETPAPAEMAANSFATRLSQIDAADLERHCRFLASDALEGRAAGSRGGQAAAAYLVSELRKLNLSPPPGQKEHRQPFGNQWANVLASLPGRHPQRKDEWILIGAHYDHVGYGTVENSNGPLGRIHNGADDNASGVAMLLELAAFFSRPEQRQDRSVLIAFWDAEEVGLYGSKHWIANPSVSLASLKFALNLDMIGRLRDDRVAVMGWRSAPGFRRRIVEANGDLGLHFEFEPAVTNDSDHYPFYAATRPVLHFDTRKHEDYHRPSDDPEKLNIAGLVRIGHFAARLIDHVVNAAELPGFRREALQEPRQPTVDTKARMAPPVRLGVRWNTQRDPQQTFLDVADVTPNTPAARAGLRRGDRLLKFDRWHGGTLAELRSAICIAPAEVDIEWQPAGQSEPRTTRIKLDGKGIRCGITYRSDPALHGCGVITSVMSHSPADRAGIRPGDILMSVADRPIPRFEEFETLLPAENGPCHFEIDREGQSQRITVELP